MAIASATHPSNVFKFCPKCGANSFGFDGFKLFTCNACGFNYYINQATAVCGVLELPDGKIILTRRNIEPRKNTLDLPGGFVDPNESAEDALIREVYEELGLEITNPVFFGSFPNEYVYKNISYFTCDMAFHVQVKDISNLLNSDEVNETVFLLPQEIKFETLSFQSIVNVVKKFITLKHQ